METSEEEEVDFVLEAALPVIVAGVKMLAGVKAKHPGVFVEVLKDR